MALFIAKPRMKIFSCHSASLGQHKTCMEFSLPMGRLALAAFFFASLLGGTGSEVFGQAPAIDWSRVARIKPNLRVIVLIQSDRALNLEDLAFLENSGCSPADRDAALILGSQKAIFKTTLRRWMERPPLPIHLQGSLLPRFRMSGIYRVGFKVEEKDYKGPLNLEITSPRDGFGQKLLSAENVVRPEGPSAIRLDSAGNRWLCVNYPEVEHGQMIHLHFGFKYLVDMVELLNHDLYLAGEPLQEELPRDVLPFLRGGYKINPALPEAVAWTEAGNPGPPDARREFSRLSKFLTQFVTYDKSKRQKYFRGQFIYSNLDQMYQEPSATLSRRMGACPDTVLLECAFLRARGIPCRTAGRFGHFFPVVYLPGRGWMSTSVTPIGIPLIFAPGPDHLPYQNWTPNIPLRTIRWEATFKIQPLEESK